MATESSDVLIHVLIFEAGNYPEKRFEMTPDALRDVARTFKGPLDVSVDFIEGPMSGKLGQLVSVEVSQDGTRLYGNIRLPISLFGHIVKHEFAPAFDRKTRALAALAIVEKNPGIKHD